MAVQDGLLGRGFPELVDADGTSWFLVMSGCGRFMLTRRGAQHLAQECGDHSAKFAFAWRNKVMRYQIDFSPQTKGLDAAL
ncbi:MAG: hypothetical protein ACLSB9_35210 [Hydrogeniiclostridium mannosilyticum]